MNIQWVGHVYQTTEREVYRIWLRKNGNLKIDSRHDIDMYRNVKSVVQVLP
jgi:hypothetical protein